MQMFCIVAVMLVGLLLRPEYIFGLLETIATLAVIVIYCMANLALTSYIRREHRDKFSIWHHVVSPWIGTLALLPVLFVTVYPMPAWPYNIAPFFFAGSLVGRFWLYAVAGAAQSRSASPGRDHAHRQPQHRGGRRGLG